MKTALVYDRINKIGGAERVLTTLHSLWPQAPLYTAVYHPPSAPFARNFQLHTSFLQSFPLAKTHHELYPWLTPLAFESFDFDKFNLVISITSAEAKAIITKPHTLHICYCLTPTRYLWSHQDQYLTSPGLGKFNSLAKKVFSRSLATLKKLDLMAASRPDYYLAISRTVQKRIQKYYQRDSQVIYPPVNTKFFAQKITRRPRGLKKLPQKYFLLVSRLTPYKKIDLAIRAMNKLNQSLVIVGAGRDEKRLKNLAGLKTVFLNQITDQQLVYVYQNCQSLIMPQEEDFGLVSLEAQSAGKPVIAFQKGGAGETVIHQKTGILFEAQTVDSLLKAVKQFNSHSFADRMIKNQAKKFDQKVFKTKIKKFVEEKWQKHQT